MCRAGRIRIRLIYVITLLMYIAISDCFGLVDFSLLMPGELYDVIFVFAFFALTVHLIRYPRLKFSFHKIILLPFLTLLSIAVVEMVGLQIEGTQSILTSISVVRELLFLSIIIVYTNMDYDGQKLIKMLIILDVIAVIVYITEMIHGGPIVRSDIHSRGIYETLAGHRVWRCWVYSPVFSLFTIPYLLMHIFKKEKVFKTKKMDKLIFVIILSGEIAKLGRTTLIAILLMIFLAYLYVDKLDLTRFIRKTLKMIMIGIALSFVVFILFNGLFRRMFDGILMILNVMDPNYRGTLAVRMSAISLRLRYIRENSCAWFGLGPLHRDYPLIINAQDMANRGVLCADSAYATFLLRYGIIGTLMYVSGCLMNFIRLKKANTYTSYAVSFWLLAILIAGVGGYDAWGKHTLLIVGILFALCIRERHGRMIYHDMDRP